MSANSLYYSQNLAYQLQNYRSQNPLSPNDVVQSSQDAGIIAPGDDSQGIPDNKDPNIEGANVESSQARTCSVRGCSSVLPSDSTTKMCEACRSRHRIYATTKRAKRKLEKAVVSGEISLGTAGPTMVVRAGDLSGAKIAEQVVTVKGDQSLEDDGKRLQSTSSISGSISFNPPPSPAWDPSAIDPRLFASQASSSSALAGALTLPAHHGNHYRAPTADNSAPSSQSFSSTSPVVSAPRNSRSSSEDSQASAALARDVDAPASASEIYNGSSSSVPPRFCSVKGCKAVIPGDYFFKMCEPCRDRYRKYGTTKRAKWKRERNAVNAELEGLRTEEDKKRVERGLKPLAECPEELQEWERGIIDEQVPEPTAATDPYFNPAPARMCTVSHCHRILPGFYRYKRCEQHRLQNRHHSKLKRVREKEVKKVGPAPDEPVSEEFKNWTPEGEKMKKIKGKRKKQDEDNEGERDDETKKKEKSVPTEPLFTHAPISMDRPEGSKTSLADKAEMIGVPPASRGIRRTNHTCTIKACYNLLAPHVPWKMCDTCRAHDRILRKNKRAADKAAAMFNASTSNDVNTQDHADDASTDMDVKASASVVSAPNSAIGDANPSTNPSASSTMISTPKSSVTIGPNEHVSSPHTTGNSNELSNAQALNVVADFGNDTPAVLASAEAEDLPQAQPPLPTVTVPVSMPFIPSAYDPGVRKKRKSRAKKNQPDTTPTASGSGLPPAATGTLPTPSPYPYLPPYPPQYHMPYYMPPPMHMPPYNASPPQAHDATSSASAPAVPASTSPGTSQPQPAPYNPSNPAQFYPPFPPGQQQFAYGAQFTSQPPYPPPYPYLPPRYISSPYSVPPSQYQPYNAGGPPATYTSTSFNYYQPPPPKTETTKRKKRKRDETVAVDPVPVSVPNSSVESSNLPPSTTAAIVRSSAPPIGSLQPPETVDMASTIPRIVEEASTADVITEETDHGRVPPGPTVRPCSNKSCHRTLSVDVHGSLCEKCRLRIKKRQAKTKQRFKLEPKKLASIPTVGENAGEDKDQNMKDQ